MNRIICDRCGKYLIDKRRGSLWAHCYSPRCTYGIFKFMLGHKQERIDVDLCLECTEELKRWMNVKENNLTDTDNSNTE